MSSLQLGRRAVRSRAMRTRGGDIAWVLLSSGFRTGGGRSRAGHSESEARLAVAPSQKGLLADWPQRQRPMAVRPARPNVRPPVDDGDVVVLHAEGTVVADDDLTSGIGAPGRRANDLPDSSGSAPATRVAARLRNEAEACSSTSLALGRHLGGASGGLGGGNQLWATGCERSRVHLGVAGGYGGCDAAPPRFND